MLFVLIIVAFIIGAIFVVVGNDNYDWREILVIPGVLLVSVSLIGIAFSLIALPIEYIGKEGYVASMHEEYESIIYQLENNIYENDNDIGKRELMKDVEDWNKWLAKSQTLQNDFWLGIYYADIYDQFELIELGGVTDGN